ncbi:efflux RND transporter permease subunit [Candidatus Nomurabacteria bacterium]|nr:efflux RND transporter permease subunit [Candidatus Nomurabacteria bacterium]
MVKSKVKTEQKKQKTNEVKFTKKDAKLLPKFTLFFFNRPRLTAILWLAVLLFGIASYTTLLKREGFPAINLPIASITGTYIVNDAAQVDTQVVKPISEVAKKEQGVKSVQGQSFSNFFTVFIQYEEGTNADEATASLEKSIKSTANLPPEANLNFAVPQFGVTGGSSQQIDMALSFYNDNGQADTKILTEKAEQYAKALKAKNLSLVKDVTVQSPFEEAQNPLTGQTQTVQQTFDRFGERQTDQNKFFNSVIIAIAGNDGFDVIKLDEQVRQAVSEVNAETKDGYQATISASFAPSIENNISELQKVLLEGLLAVLIVGSLVIAVRASLITVVSMITVLGATLALLFLLGFTLNVITLFAIILSLSLIVDDTIIMVEAIDAQRRRQKDAKKAVEEATRKVSRAMIAATLTAALSFAPLVFVGGILGNFIRAIPITIISALLISLVVALVFIPLFAKFILLGKKQMGEENVKEIGAGVEAKIAKFISSPMLWARTSIKRRLLVGLTAVFIGTSFIVAAGFIGRNVIFNIFPPSKDADSLQVTLTFAPGTDITQAQVVADKANKIVGDTLGSNFDTASYYGVADNQSAPLSVNLISYSKRDETSKQLIGQLEKNFQGFSGAQVAVRQVDAGPPASPFTVRIDSENREQSFKLAGDIAKFLKDREITRPSGEKAQITEVNVSNPGTFARKDGALNVSVTASFNADDTTTLVTVTQAEVEKEFTPEKIRSYGLEPDAVVFDFGQESENQDSFATLAIAFPALLAVIYVLLATQFRSLLQPLLIFMALPFSLFGITLGLYLTNNPFSFFAMLGFFALIGLSIKNTILLTDYANQARRSGMGAIDAAHEALAERFRPLIATSLTAVVSLIPLAITSPFWEGLAIVLISGLLSSTFLVITVFPYYYLGAEYLRSIVNRKEAIGWLVVTAGAVALVATLGNAGLALALAGLSVLVGMYFIIARTVRIVRQIS